MSYWEPMEVYTNICKICGNERILFVNGKCLDCLSRYAVKYEHEIMERMNGKANRTPSTRDLQQR